MDSEFISEYLLSDLKRLNHKLANVVTTGNEMALLADEIFHDVKLMVVATSRRAQGSTVELAVWTIDMLTKIMSDCFYIMWHISKKNDKQIRKYIDLLSLSFSMLIRDLSIVVSNRSNVP